MLKPSRKYGGCDFCFRAGSIYDCFDSSTSPISPSLLSFRKCNIKYLKKKAYEQGSREKENCFRFMARLDSLLGIQKSSTSINPRAPNDDESRRIVIEQELLELLSKSSDHVDDSSRQVSECTSSVSMSKASFISKASVIDSTRKLQIEDHSHRIDCNTSITVTSSPLRKRRIKESR